MQSPAEVMVHVEGVTKRYGTLRALRGVDLQLQRGKYLAVFGPNGAGKTTLLKILATLIRPSSGTVTIAGYNAVQAAERVRPLLGVLSHRTYLYGHLTAMENLQFYGRLLGVASLAERIAEVLQTVGLGHEAQRLVRTYSRGMQQRLAIARAMLHRPDLLLLDEPYTGLDQQAMAQVQTLLHGLHATNQTMIMSTHDLQRGLELCDEVVIQHHGQIVHRSLTTQHAGYAFERLYNDYVC